MFLSIWPKPNKYIFKKKKKINKEHLQIIENFFVKQYNSKYCVLVPSARSGIVLSFIYKKINKSKIIKIPKWSSSCLYSSLGTISNLTCNSNNFDAALVVHTLGNTFNTNKKSILVDDSSDSLPKKNFVPYINSKFSDVISLPKIIGSYCGGLVLTNNKSFYKFLKSQQIKNISLAYEQSLKKYKSNILKNINFDWFYHEAFNFSLDFNTCENVFHNLDNFFLNQEIIEKRRKILKSLINSIDEHRLGPCLQLDYDKRYSKFLETRHFNVTQSIHKEKFIKKLILPIHFTISDREFYKKLNAIKKN